MRRSAFLLPVGLLLLAGQVSAQELKTFLYDAQGRMIGVARDVVGIANHSAYVFDDATNRTSRNIGAVPARAAVNELRPGETLIPVQQLTSPNGQARLVFQADGNLVLYSGNAVRWNSGTGTGRSLRLEMQGDGNLVLYDPTPSPLWSVITGTPGARLVLQSDCNLVIYSGSTALWNTGTSC